MKALSLSAVLLVIVLVAPGCIFSAAKLPGQIANTKIALVADLAVGIKVVEAGTHAAALSLGTPAALGVDAAVQQALAKGNVDVTVVMGKVKAAANDAEALLAARPLIAEANAVLLAIGKPDWSAVLTAAVKDVQAALAALGS